MTLNEDLASGEAPRRVQAKGCCSAISDKQIAGASPAAANIGVVGILVSIAAVDPRSLF